MAELPRSVSRAKPEISGVSQNFAVSSDSMRHVDKQSKESLVPAPDMGETPEPQGNPPEYGEYMQKQQEIELLKQQKIQQDDLLKQLHQKTRELEDLNQQAKLLQNTPVSVVNTTDGNTLTNQTVVNFPGSVGNNSKNTSSVSQDNPNLLEGYQASTPKSDENVPSKQPPSSSIVQVKVEPKFDLNKSVDNVDESCFQSNADVKSQINPDSSGSLCKLNCVLCDKHFSDVLELESHVQTHTEVLHFSLLLKEAVSLIEPCHAKTGL